MSWGKGVCADGFRESSIACTNVTTTSILWNGSFSGSKGGYLRGHLTGFLHRILSRDPSLEFFMGSTTGPFIVFFKEVFHGFLHLRLSEGSFTGLL